MRLILQLVSAIALALTILPAVLFLIGKIDLDQVKWLMLLAAAPWFAATPLWMGRPSELKEEVVP